MLEPGFFEFQISATYHPFVLQIACSLITLFQCTFPEHELRFASREAKRTNLPIFKISSEERSSLVELKNELRACCET